MKTKLIYTNFYQYVIELLKNESILFFCFVRLLSENIPINQNQENGKNKNALIKIAFKKSANNYGLFTSKLKSRLSPSSNNTYE